jgi:hypothetical protein
MAKSSKELLNKEKKKKQRTSSKKTREYRMYNACEKEKKRNIKFINVHEMYEKATVGALFVSCC